MGRCGEGGPLSLFKASLCPLAHLSRPEALCTVCFHYHPHFTYETNEAQDDIGRQGWRSDLGLFSPNPICFALPCTNTPSPAAASPLTSFLALVPWGNCSSGGLAGAELGQWPWERSPVGKDCRSPIAAATTLSSQQPFLQLALAPWPGAGEKLCLLPSPLPCPPHRAQWSKLLLARCFTSSRISGLGLIARKAFPSSPGSKT